MEKKPNTNLIGLYQVGRNFVHGKDRMPRKNFQDGIASLSHQNEKKKKKGKKNQSTSQANWTGNFPFLFTFSILKLISNK